MDQAHTPIRGAIAAMTRENVIGLGGKIPWYYSEDLKRFKRVTLDCTIIMGRLTWESIGCRPLPRRRNIVIGQNPTNNNPVNADPANHVEHFRSIERAIDACAGENVWDYWRRTNLQCNIFLAEVIGYHLRTRCDSVSKRNQVPRY